MKKVLALLAATALIASAALTPAVGFTASAEDSGNGSITITDSYSETYTAYQVFSGTITIDSDTRAEILTSIEWGAAVLNNSDALLQALKSDSVIRSYFEECTSAEDVAGVIKEFGDDSDNLIIFANIVAAFCDTSTGTSSSDGSTTITGLEDGYYLVAGTAADGANTTSRYILMEVDGTDSKAETTTAKNALPTVQKYVWDEAVTGDAEQDSTAGWGESADHDLGETFRFALEASLPEEKELTYYNNYQIIFHDTYNSGITTDTDTIRVYVTNDTEGTWKQDGNKAFTNEATSSYTYVDITSECQTSTPTTPATSLSDDCSFEVTVTDLVASLEKNSTGWSLGTTALSVIVVYEAKLNDEATVWAESVNNNGNAKTNDGTVDDNVVYLTYSNNPNYTTVGESTDESQQSEEKWKGLEYNKDKDGNTTQKPKNKTYDTEQGTTENDYVWLFTYQLEVTKMDESSNLLAGAEFTLTDKNNQTGYFTKDASGIYWFDTWDSSKASDGATTTLTSGDDGKITIKGLDVGTYTFTEETAPAGYNKAEPYSVTITATHAEKDDGVTVNNTLAYADENSNTGNFTIVDKSGTSLPTTGGIGTTVFYVVGGVIVVGAGVLLITRKRANNV